MQVNITVRNFEASQKLQDFAIKELTSLKRFFDGDMTGEILLRSSGNLKTVETRINILGKILPAKVEGDDFYKMIPKAVDKLKTQLKSTKSKKFNR